MSRYGLDGCPGCPDCHETHDCEGCGRFHLPWSAHQRDAERRRETVGERLLVSAEVDELIDRWKDRVDVDVLRDVLESHAFALAAEETA